MKTENRTAFEGSSYTPTIRNEQTDMLMQAMLHMESLEDAYRFFEDLCTIAELKSIAQRFDVAVMLRQKETYQDIVRKTGASSATISRVNRALLYGADGYNRVLNRMAKDGLLPGESPDKE
ncbi:MAG: YerC/YecD family TrpR-related protein [Clostridia bacterium]|nr:YerC/YecD family TrpR-related protein [Clostridia bacterium]